MKIRMEISSLATPSISGVGFYTKRLAEALDNRSDADFSAVYFNFLNRQPQPNVSLKNALQKNQLIPLRVYAKLQSYNLAPPFDLFLPSVDLTIFPNFATWPTIKSKLRATVVHDLTYLYFPEHVEEKNLAHLRRVVPRSIKNANFIITVSDAVKSELVKEFSLDPDRCLVTPIPPESIFFESNTNEIHKKYSLPTEKYIYFIGNLEPRKNLPTLIEAYRQLPPEIKKEYSLVLAGGKGWKTEKSQQALDDAKAADENVIHVGYIDHADAPAFLQKASLFVLPSFYEGFGMPVLEAMASQSPVLCADIPVLHEVAGEAALFADPHNASDFAEKIATILSSPEIAHGLRDKSKLQLEKISWDDNARRVIDYADNLLKKS